MNTALSVFNIFCLARLCTLAVGSDVASDMRTGPLNPTTTSRDRRSTKGLHSRLCPPGASRESCFVNQLMVYMRMQDSLLDPVALRNIGKRSGEIPPMKIPDKSSDPWSFYLEPLVSGTSFFGDHSEDLDNQRFTDVMLDGFKTDDYVPEGYDSLSTDSFDGRSDTQNVNDNGLSTVQKRQIICPNGMSRIKCYNNALAFYMRLLRTVKAK